MPYAIMPYGPFKKPFQLIILQVCDILSDSGSGLRTDFDICVDKGTYDAISLSSKANENRPTYRSNVASMLKPKGLFFVTSCNWTEAELRAFFSSHFKVRVVLPTPTFQFGGQTGRNVTSIVFEKE